MADLATLIGYRRLTVSTSVVDLTDAADPSSGGAAAIPAGARYCTIKVTGYPCNVRVDGTDPTSSIGFPLAVGDILEEVTRNTNIEFIRSAASDSVLEILWWA